MSSENQTHRDQQVTFLAKKWQIPTEEAHILWENEYNE